MNKIEIRKNENGWSAYSQDEKIMQDYASLKEAYYNAISMYKDSEYWTVIESSNDFDFFLVK